MEDMDIKDLKSLINELDVLFSADDDVNELCDIAKMKREIASHSQQNVKDAKDIIKGVINLFQIFSKKSLILSCF
jgi:hypothetical protein